MGFTKLDEGILQSSIMAEAPETFKVFIAILASCGADGIARVSSTYLAAACYFPLDIVDASIAVLEAPDPRSRSLNDDGCRIRRVDGGYFVINYEKYRAFTPQEGNPHSAGASRTRRWREKKRLSSVTTSPVVTGRDVTSVTSASVLEDSSLSLTYKRKENHPEDTRLVQLLIDMMLRNNPESSIIQRLTPARRETWIRECRLLRESDRKTPEQVEAVIRFSQDDPFWRSNILSMPKLREKWDQLWMKAKRDDPNAGIKEWLKDQEDKDAAE